MDGRTESIIEMDMRPRQDSVGKRTLVIADEKDIEKKKLIGEGCFGSVYEGSLTNSGKTEKVAIKCIKANDLTSLTAKNFTREATFLASCNHPNLIPITGIHLTPVSFWIIMPLEKKGSLLNHLLLTKKSINSGDKSAYPELRLNLIYYIYQIADGMAYLHDKDPPLIHRDLACRNILLGANDVVKISDFGLVRNVNDLNDKVGERLPIKWLALESLKTFKFNQKTDVWSFGVTVWEILTLGNSPFKNVELDTNKIVELLESGSRLRKYKIKIFSSR